MIGLMFFGAIALWFAVAIAIALGLGHLLPERPWRSMVKIALIPFVFFAPVADEIIAWPQMRELCKGTGRFEFGPGMNEQKALGRSVYYRYKSTEERRKLFPDVEVLYISHDYVDAQTGEIILRFHSVEPKYSFFAYPDAGGSRNTWILSDCWSAKVNTSPDESKLRLNVVESLSLSQTGANHGDNK